MDRARYDDYLACFNRRDYEAVLAFWADDFEIVFAGYRLRGREQMLSFYLDEQGRFTKALCAVFETPHS